MGNILDYIDWRGDLTFEQAPFNRVDNLILACLSYLDLDEIREVQGKKQTELKDLWRLFEEKNADKLEKAETSFIRNIPALLEKMAGSGRFGTCLAGNYVNEILATESQQFAALTIRLPDGTTYLSFRGTDDTIVGWKEDFKLGSGIVSSQKKALEYMYATGRNSSSMLRLGGHSKGGNLAMYCAMCCDRETRSRILAVYDNDGPGFTEDFFQGKDTEELMPKILRIIPEASVIGMLLAHIKEPVIVSSTQRGILQHDAFTWEILGPDFITKNELTRRAAASDRTLHKWIDNMDREQREMLTEELFSVLEAPGVRTISGLQDGGLKSLGAMIRKLDKMEPESKAMIQELITGLFGSWLELLPLPELDKKRFLP